MRSLAMIAVLGVLAALPARAASPEIEARYSKDYKACTDQAQSTLDMIGCRSDERDVQDKALNAAYQKTLAGLTAPQRTKLRDAQRAWIAYRDAWCGAQQDDDWGTLSKIAAAQCLLDETIRRTIDLENYPPQT